MVTQVQTGKLETRLVVKFKYNPTTQGYYLPSRVSRRFPLTGTRTRLSWAQTIVFDTIDLVV